MTEAEKSEIEKAFLKQLGLMLAVKVGTALLVNRLARRWAA